MMEESIDLLKGSVVQKVVPMTTTSITVGVAVLIPSVVPFVVCTGIGLGLILVKER